MLKLTSQIWKKISGKIVQSSLIAKHDGPFEVVKKVGEVVYWLNLSKRLNIHLTFHLSYLKLFYKDAEDPTRSEFRCALPIVWA